ncbi:MAG: glycosyltransferase, partial [Candidatus Eremiobacterota bacterium]
MDILYVSELCSNEVNKKIMQSYPIKSGQESQKMHYLFTAGLKENDCKVSCLSILGMNRKLSKKLFFNLEDDHYEGIDFTYVSFINLSLIRQLCIMFGVFFNIIIWTLKHRKNRVIICDVLNFSALVGCIVSSKVKGCKVIGIAPDIPTFRVGSLYSRGIKGLFFKIYNTVNLFFSRCCDAFILITEQMGTIINRQNKPSIVIEGQVDHRMTGRDNYLNNKYERKVCHYAGGLLKIYGLEILVKGFIKANLPNTELHIYGGGSYENELKDIVSQNKNIKFFGYVSNEIVVNEQLKSTLLINPRPTNEEYTKYSFPSKNMEYMVSGTPVLTTNLPGMPGEYAEYVYVIEDESEDGIKDSLCRILSKSPEDLHNKGLRAKEFVLREKNNVVQAKKIIKLAKNIIKENR